MPDFGYLLPSRDRQCQVVWAYCKINARITGMIKLSETKC